MAKVIKPESYLQGKKKITSVKDIGKRVVVHAVVPVISGRGKSNEVKAEEKPKQMVHVPDKLKAEIEYDKKLEAQVKELDSEPVFNILDAETVSDVIELTQGDKDQILNHIKDFDPETSMTKRNSPKSLAKEYLRLKNG